MKIAKLSLVTASRLTILAAALLLAGIQQAPAQSWPNGPVKMFVGFGAGGSTDIIARDLGHELEKIWGQPVIVENRAGAAGNIGTEAVFRAAPI